MNAGMQVCRHVCMQTCKYTSMQECKYASMQPVLLVLLSPFNDYVSTSVPPYLRIMLVLLSPPLSTDCVCTYDRENAFEGDPAITARSWIFMKLNYFAQYDIWNTKNILIFLMDHSLSRNS